MNPINAMNPIANQLTDHFVFELLEKVDLILKDYVYNGYEALSHYLTPILTLVTTLYIVILGWGLLTGNIKMDMKQMFKAILSIAFIYAAVTNWGFVQEYFVNFINSLINGIGDALVSATPLHVPGGVGIDGALQVAMDQFLLISEEFIHHSHMYNWSPFFEGIGIGFFAWVIIAISLFELILAKVMIAILMIFTPMMAILCYFKRFRSIFDTWLGMIIGFMLLNFFVIIVVAFALDIIYAWIGAYTINQLFHAGISTLVVMVILSIVSVGLLLKVSQYAMVLGGAAGASGGGSALMGGMIGGAVGAAMPWAKMATAGTAKTAKGTINGLKKLGERLRKP